jgi:hypothetical protein
MKNTGRHSEKSGYLVILLLLVGLTAFSHTMKELTDFHHLTLDASRVMAQWSGNVPPAEVPPVQVAQIEKIEKIQSCESQHSVAIASGRTQQIKIKRVTRPLSVTPGDSEIAKLRKLQRIDIDADEFQVRIPSVQFPETGELPAPTDIPAFTFKSKARKHSTIRFSPRDREMLLKTLSRSINLRIAS